jgi:outer membrane protein assembly factor BamB
MYRHDPKHTGRSDRAGPSVTPHVLWTTKTNTTLSAYCPPSIAADGTLYLSAEIKESYAISPNGQVKWTAATEGNCEASPAIGSDGTVYIARGPLYALAPDGTQRWSFTPGAQVGDSPVIAEDGTIYILSEAGILFGLAPDGGEQSNFTTSFGKTSPALADDGTIYFGANQLYGIDPGGSAKWGVSIGDAEHVSPLVGSDGTIYALSSSSTLTAISPDGTVQWALPVPLSSAQFPPALGADGVLYLPVSGKLSAIRAADGSAVWQIDQGTQFSPFIDSEGTIYFADSQCFLRAITADGTEKWSLSLGGSNLGSCGAPVMDGNGIIYVISTAGGLIAVGP